METEPEQKKHLFTNKQLWALLVPVVVEQILNSLMGTADTMMVSNVGSAAISAVSLVDSINVLVIQVFAALAAGGTIICSQYIVFHLIPVDHKPGTVCTKDRSGRILKIGFRIVSDRFHNFFLIVARIISF